MSHVFISYSKSNSDYAIQLADKLLAEGFDIWIDRRRLRPSQNWWREIVQGLRGCSAFIVILTPESDASEWVQREIALANKWHKPLFPILLSGDIESDNWSIFVLTQYEDVRHGGLPSPDFYHYLAERAPQKSQPGEDVTKAQSAVPLDTDAQLEAANPPEADPTPLPFPSVPQYAPGRQPMTPVAPPQSLSSSTPQYAPGRQPMTDLPPDVISPRRISRVGLALVAVTAVVVIVALLLLASNPPGTLTDAEKTATMDAANILGTETAIRTTATALARQGEIFAQETAAALTQTAAVEPITPTHTAVSSPTPMPTPLGGGLGKIVFASDRDGNSEIYVTNVDGSNQQRLTNIQADNYDPSWSPDGTKIAFYSQRDGNAEIYVMNADGSNLQRLSNDDSDDYDPSWSPDGTKIAFHSQRDGNAEIYVMNADGSNQQRLTNDDSDDSTPEWSTNGAKIAFASNRDGNAEIYIMNADGSNQQRLTNIQADDYSPVWSPDGTKIVFGTTRDGNAEIYVMDANGSNIRRLTDDLGYDYDPRWSPDGTKIVFESVRDGNDEIFIMNADGGNPINLTNSSASDYTPDWR